MGGNDDPRETALRGWFDSLQDDEAYYHVWSGGREVKLDGSFTADELRRLVAILSAPTPGTDAAGRRACPECGESGWVLIPHAPSCRTGWEGFKVFTSTGRP